MGKEKKEKKSKKALWIIIIVVSLFVIIGSLGGKDDSKSTTSTSSVSSTAAKESVSKSNVMLSKEMHEADVKSGTGVVIGTYAYIEMPLDELKEVSEEDYAEFCKERIDANKDKYNYFIIYTSEDEGILYYSCSSMFGDYGSIDKSQTITNIQASVNYNTSTKKYEYELIDQTREEEAATDSEPVSDSEPVNPKPDDSATIGQKNALNKALRYLSHSAFSYTGLIGQLEYEGFTTEEATYAVDNCSADWKDQAAKKAESYLKHSSFSRSGLIEQLIYEGFSEEEAEYGVTAAGY